MRSCVRSSSTRWGRTAAAVTCADSAGIYFVDDGYAKSDDEALCGEVELADPRGPLPAMVAPQFGFRIPGGVTAGQVETIRPQTGMILLHPSWQPRGERRFEGAGPRVAIEFDLLAP